MGGVRTSIIEGPRPSPRHRRAEHYTLNPEEPVKRPLTGIDCAIRRSACADTRPLNNPVTEKTG